MHPTEAAQRLSKAVDGLSFQAPVATVYNPLQYAWDGHRQYTEAFGDAPKPLLLVGMNPGPWGMGQTGVPFGDVDKVRAMGITEIQVEPPATPIEKRPVHGLSCERNEVSGTRLYGGLEEVFGDLPSAYEHLYIANYAPQLFYDEEGKNLTPPRLRKAEREMLFEPCDDHLQALIEHFDPEHVVGVGKFAQRRAQAVLDAMGREAQAGYLLHPSPANPMANKDGGAHWQAKLQEMVESTGIGPA